MELGRVGRTECENATHILVVDEEGWPPVPTRPEIYGEAVRWWAVRWWKAKTANAVDQQPPTMAIIEHYLMPLYR